MTAPAYADSPPAEAVLSRLARLETDLGELRDTFTRFADLSLGELQVLRGRDDISRASFGPDAASASGPTPARRPWLFLELGQDLLSAARMYADSRYRLRRTTQLLVPLLLAGLAFNWFVFRQFFAVWVVGPVLEKCFDILLAVLLYRVVQQEVGRYREVLRQLAAWHDYAARHPAAPSTTTVIYAGQDAGPTREEPDQ